MSATDLIYIVAIALAVIITAIVGVVLGAWWAR
jgi:hypothetical protein